MIKALKVLKDKINGIEKHYGKEVMGRII